MDVIFAQGIHCFTIKEMPNNTANNYDSIFDNVDIFDIHNKLVTSLLMEDISDVKSQLHHLHFEEYFIQQKKGNNRQHLC